MSTTHSCIAHFVTSHLEPAAHCEEESSVERGHRAEIAAWSLTRLASNLIRRLRGETVGDEGAAYEVAVMRLSELSPHLLIDVGIDPATGHVAEDGVTLVLPRPVRVEEPAVLPAEATPSRPASWRRLRINVLAGTGAAAKPLPV